MSWLPVVRVKDGVNFKFSPGGIRILSALDHLATEIGHDVTITSGADGTHSGPDDPHFKGDAYDNRTHDLPNKHLALKIIQDFLGERFFSWIEDENGPNEHIHTQVKKGTVFPPEESPSQPPETPFPQ